MVLSRKVSLVFIDSSISDYSDLAVGVVPGAKVIILEQEQDGIKQITETLKEYCDFDSLSIHIVSHGSPGCLYLGNSQLSLDTLPLYASDLKTWFDPPALSRTPLDKGGRGDLLLYGCNVAAGDAGAEFIAKLRNLTDAEITASTTPIGNKSQGGDWELDFTTSLDKPQLAFTSDTQQNYVGVFTTISGNAFIDFNNDGQKRATVSGNLAAEDVGLSGITVTAYYSDGSTDTTTTDANGDYTLNNPSDLAARVEFTNLPQSYQFTASDVFFVDGGTGTNTTDANLGVINPNFYISDTLDPTLITTCFVLGSFFGSTETAIVSVLHSASGDNPTKTTHATIGEVGAVNGLAYSKETEDLFLGAFQKRFADTGLQGNATIYRVDGTTGAVSTFINLEDFFGASIAGDYSHGDNQTQQDSIDGNIAWDADKDAFSTTTKAAFGDVEISEDRQFIYTVNLADRKIYKIQIGADGDSTATIDYTAGDTRTIETFDVVSGVSGSLFQETDDTRTTAELESDIRPFGLAEKDGLIYVGLVDSAQNSQRTADLHAYVYTLDPASGNFTKVLDFDLDYDRQDKTNFTNANGSIVQSANWTPWVDNFSDLTFTDRAAEGTDNRYWVDQTQPILSDIEFDNNGDMILGFRDRTADQIAGQTLDLDGNLNPDGGTYEVASGGDLLRADVSVTNQWTIESSVTNNTNATNEFYGDEEALFNIHGEGVQGGIVQIPGFTSVESTTLDPTDNADSGGIRGFNNSSGGTQTRGIQLFDNTGEIDKANGLGDLEALTTLAPIQVGDRIWNDTDGDGIQDPEEAGIDGVTLSLYDSGGTLVGQTTTTNGGEYFFNDGNVNQNGATGLETSSDYEVRVDSSNFASGTGALDGLNLSLTNIGNNDSIDSDAVDVSGTPTIAFTTGTFGENNFTLDAGFTDTTFDFGDAPDVSSGTGEGNYQTTLSDSGASHIITVDLNLGAEVDADAGTLQNTAADADDNDGTPDDEDGVTLFPTLSTADSGNNYSVTVNYENTGADATLVGWIDFNGDGVFDSTEAASATVTSANSSQVLNWTIPSGTDIKSGTTYARFRISRDVSLDTSYSTGAASDGEVEDYQLTIVGGTDYGDAPDDGGTNGNYGTTSANDGAAHTIVEGLSIGNTVDSDSGLLENSTATADDSDGLSDEASITSFPTLEIDDSTYSITVSVNNTTGNPATLIGWIDFDGSGTFESDEAVTVAVPDGTDTSSPVTLEWNNGDGDANNDIPSDITSGDTFARFRLSTDTTGFDTTTPTGLADDGEVEDYALTINQVFDYGDAPDTSSGTGTGDYQTTTTNSSTDAPSHAITSGLSLGSTIDADDGTLQNPDASADDASDTGSADDEDGVTFTNSGVFASDDGSYSVTVNVTNTDSQNVTVVGWIDFDQSGTFDADEAVSTSGVLTGNQNLTWSSFPDDIVAGNTFARFRLSNDSSLSASTPTGSMSDGEIEDYQVTINGVDYGDAPDSDGSIGAGNYDTTVDTDGGTTDVGGAAHTILSGLSLGSSVDADNGTLQNSGATADDTTDGNDDEDGVTSFNPLTISSTDYTVDVDVTHTGSAATLIGWIDFDGDGNFEAEEASAPITGIASSGSQELTWSGIQGLTDPIASGTTYVRLRLSDGTLSDSTPTGLIGNGEVEDYAITIGGGTDFGDAPDDNGTNYDYNTVDSENGASHEIVSGLSIGATVDSESDGAPGTNADGDDLAGIDDEDGVTFVNGTVISTTDTTYSVEVIVNSPGGSGTNTIASDDFSTNNYSGGSAGGTGSDWDTVWTDSEGNGSAAGVIRADSGFLELRNDGRSAQRTITIPASATGTIELSFDYAEAGNDLGADDPLQIVVGTTTYTIPQGTAAGTQTIDITSAVTPGNAVILEFNTDQLNGVGNDDGFDIDNVTITEATTSDTTLVGWVDFDGSGTFDPGEGVSLSTADSTPLVTDGVTPNTLTWDGGGSPLASTTGDTYARFRLSTDSNLTTNTPDDSVNDITDGEVEDYQLTIAEVDYGDAPDTASGTGVGNYQTTASDNGAAHAIDSNLTIGSTIDGDDGTLQNLSADADDSSNTGSADDEDGITAFNSLNTSDTSHRVNIDVANNTGGAATLIGWIDFDGNGAFEADEAVILPVVDNGGTPTSVSLVWDNSDGSTDNDIPNDITSGTTYARFRLSNDFNTITTRDDITNNPSLFTDIASDGEVEDYQLTIAGGTDYGDAPDDGGTNGNYGTTSTNNGAAHTIVNGLSIGETIDGDDGTLQNITADADNNDATNDEDGITSFPTLETDDSTYSVSVPVNNTTGSSATLIGWIDFDGNGTFDSDEAVTASVPDGTDTSSPVTLEWNNGDGDANNDLPADIVGGTTYARFRLSTDTTGFDTTTPTGLADDGEVEDYQLTITQITDYGDAPDDGGTNGNYGTTSANDGAAHGVVDGLTIGSTVDGDDGTLENSTADADDASNTGSADDEDGVTSLTALNSDATTYNVDLPVNNSTGETATLIGWIDFDGNGTFDSDEAVTASVPDGTTTSSPVALTWNSSDIPTDITNGNTFARFRLSTDSSLTTSTPTGFVTNGEVEDHPITINGVDYGDAPDDGVAGNGVGDYNTVSGNSGAAHTISGDLALGATINAVDGDSGTLQNSGATADDTTDGNDDEDGVTSFNTLSLSDAGSTYNISVNYANTGAAATLVGWIDFNQDGVFDPITESATASVSGTGSQTLTFNVPSDTTNDFKAGTTYARFRISRDAGFGTDDPTGLAGDGEVEDYAITVEGGTDYGDAPDTGTSYNTAGANAASHDIVSGLSIGATVDSESDGAPSTNADGDDTAGTDDEDGVTFVDGTAISTTDTTYSVEVIVNSPGGSGTNTIASDTFDTNGSFAGGSNWDSNWAEAPEGDGAGAGNVQISGNTLQVRNDGRSASRTLTIPANATGTIELSFNYTEVGDGLNTGEGDGDDDELQVVISDPTLGTRTEVITLGSSANQTFDITADVTPGNVVTIEYNTDLLDGVDSNDGFNIDNVTITETTTSDTTLVGWVDFDGSGTFESGEGVSLSTADSTPLVTDGVTPNTLTWDGGGSPLASTTGDTYARFRLSTDSNLSTSTPDDSVNDITDGEVEDYQLTIAEVDYGDAPDTGSGTGAGNYETTDANGGASHGIISGLSIGSEVDGDDGTLQNTTATADDVSNTGSADDEDGVTFSDILTSNANSYTLDVDVTNSTTEDATLIGWIDFDGDGAFEADEAATATVSNGATSAQLNWTGLQSLPDGFNAGTTYARFRLSSDFNAITIDDNTSVGAATDGEVEDYQITIKNTVTGTGASEAISTSGTTILSTTEDDFISAGAGQDTLTGGAGNDCFHFNKTSDGIDIITDFDATDGDKLDFSDIVAGELSSITFTNNPFDDGYVEAITFGSGVMIQLDADPGDSLFNKNVVFLSGVALGDVDASDFVF